MSEPLEVLYFNWLCAKVRRRDFPLYYNLLKVLYTTEFTWLLPMDENRAEDGKELRLDFVRETGFEPDSEWEAEGCSVLEMLVAFSYRAWFETEIPSREWFWRMIENLSLDELRHMSKADIPMVNVILRKFVQRQYPDNGYGSLFPMMWPKEDQRAVDIWQQFCAYVEEQRLV